MGALGTGLGLARWRGLLFVFPLGLVAVASCGDGNAGGSYPSSVDVSEVLQEERTFVDPTRPTRANGSAPALTERTLVTLLWYAPTPLRAPACRGSRCGLVLLAHGFGGRTSRFDGVARRLAAAGYIVAAPAFPLTNQDTPGGHRNGLSDVVEQPKDLSAVIDGILAAARSPSDLLYERIDGERIGAVGHSLGGTTVVAATHHNCCRDRRIGATVLVAPAIIAVAPFFGSGPSPQGPPLLIVNGRNDPLITPASSLEFARSLAPPWYFLEIIGADHVFLIENIGEPLPPLFVTVRATLAFFDEHLGGAAGAMRHALEDLEVEGHVPAYSE